MNRILRLCKLVDNIVGYFQMAIRSLQIGGNIWPLLTFQKILVKGFFKQMPNYKLSIHRLNKLTEEKKKQSMYFQDNGRVGAEKLLKSAKSTWGTKDGH
jgi:hypothetical protein